MFSRREKSLWAVIFALWFLFFVVWPFVDVVLVISDVWWIHIELTNQPQDQIKTENVNESTETSWEMKKESKKKKKKKRKKERKKEKQRKKEMTAGEWISGGLMEWWIKGEMSKWGESKKEDEKMGEGVIKRKWGNDEHVRVWGVRE